MTRSKQALLVADRGPYAAGYDIDLSLAAAREIALICTGPGDRAVIGRRLGGINIER